MNALTPLLIETAASRYPRPTLSDSPRIANPQPTGIPGQEA